ncbi:MAG TPA: xylulose kinase [Deltaproteobacteria bacterium]|jgi:xylulokinase|nr:xylulose kinase [Deltaproteobacteria bacterium]
MERQTMSAADRYVLAIDLGSGSLKVALVSPRAEVVAAAERELRTRLVAGGGAEQDPNEWWNAVLQCAREVLSHAQLPAQQVLALRCTTQWAVTVPVDEDGEALSPALSWMDTRGGPHSRALVSGVVAFGGYDLLKLWRWIRLTGGAPTRSGVDGLGHALYLKYEQPAVYARTHKLLEPMDYLNLKLTGRIAASFGTIFPYWLTDNRDPRKIAYDPRLLQLAKIERAKLPDLLPVDAVVGTLRPAVADVLRLSATTKVLAGLCDGPAATVGAGIVDDYEGYFYIGTTSWLSCHVPEKKTDLMHSILTMPAALPGRYMVVAEQGTAGRCLEFLKDNLLYPPNEPGVDAPSNIYEILDAQAAKVAAGSDGLIFTPWINGVLAPSEDPATRSAFFNQSARTTRSHYIRAVMEGVAFNLRWLKGHVEKFVGRRFERLNFIGGAALSEVWCQILADILGCPVRRVANPRYANAVGAALTAFAALGEIRAEDIPSLVKISSVYQPNPASREVYDRQFAEFVACFRRMKPIYRRLNPPSRAKGV